MVIHDKEVLALVEELPVNSEDEVAALGELPMVIHDKEVLALLEELPVNSEDEVAALGVLPMVIHDKEVLALVEELPANSEDEEVDDLEELPTDPEKGDVVALCPWRAYKE
jgi:hypothetical protein